jgi:hypothetical protein
MAVGLHGRILSRCRRSTSPERFFFQAMAMGKNIPSGFFALERFNQSNPQNGKTRYVNLSAIMVWSK